MNWIALNETGHNFSYLILMSYVSQFLLPNGAPSTFASDVVHTALNKDTQSQWHESVETFSVIVDKHPFDNGKTKKVFKIIFASVIIYKACANDLCPTDAIYKFGHYLCC